MWQSLRGCMTNAQSQPRRRMTERLQGFFLFFCFTGRPRRLCVSGLVRQAPCAGDKSGEPSKQKAGEMTSLSAKDPNNLTIMIRLPFVPAAAWHAQNSRPQPKRQVKPTGFNKTNSDDFVNMVLVWALWILSLLNFFLKKRHVFTRRFK